MVMLVMAPKQLADRLPAGVAGQVGDIAAGAIDAYVQKKPLFLFHFIVLLLRKPVSWKPCCTSQPLVLHCCWYTSTFCITIDTHCAEILLVSLTTYIPGYIHKSLLLLITADMISFMLLTHACTQMHEAGQKRVVATCAAPRAAACVTRPFAKHAKTIYCSHRSRVSVA
jgi:hypothetical protein